MFFTGIDQHRLRSTLRTFTATGEPVGEATLPNDRAVLAPYFGQLVVAALQAGQIARPTIGAKDASRIRRPVLST